jgi:hypothetical protein
MRSKTPEPPEPIRGQALLHDGPRVTAGAAARAQPLEIGSSGDRAVLKAFPPKARTILGKQLMYARGSTYVQRVAGSELKAKQITATAWSTSDAVMAATVNIAVVSVLNRCFPF